jgi:modulator of FtsH protease HflC
MIVGDETRLEVQSYARVRIVDPLRFYQALRTNEMANAQLVSSSTRRALGQVPLRALLTEERGHILDVIKGEVAAKAVPLGIEVDEVRFDRSDMPFETSQAILPLAADLPERSRQCCADHGREPDADFIQVRGYVAQTPVAS